MLREIMFLLLFVLLSFQAYAKERDSVLSESLYDEDTSESVLYSNTTTASTSKDSNQQSVASSENQYTFYHGAMSWIEALLTCWEDGKELAIPRSSQEAEILSDLLFKYASNINSSAAMKDAIHVGIHTNSRNEWTTVTGKKISQAGYNQWLDGGEGNCGALFLNGRFFKVSCATSLAFICQKVEAKSLVGHNYTSIPGVGRFVLHTSPLPWAQAQKQCEVEGGALAVPHSARVAGLVAGTLFSRLPPSQRSSGCFIGASDVAEEGKWIVDSGLTLRESGYESWRPNLPSGNRSENCALLMEDGLYKDHSCLSPMPFCCEIPGNGTGTSETVFNSDDYWLYVDRVNWWEAVSSCHKQNMTLALPRTESEADAILSLIRKAKSKGSDVSENVHVGMHNINEMQIWKNLLGYPVQDMEDVDNPYRYPNEQIRNSHNYYGWPHSAGCGKLNVSPNFSNCFEALSYVCTSYY